MHVRYDTATRRVKHLSVPSFTTSPDAGEMDGVLTDAPYPGPVAQLRLTADLAALEVDAALVPAPAEDAAGLRLSLGTIFAGTALRRRARWADVLEAYPAAGVFLTLLRDTLTPDARDTLVELAGRIKARIGALDQVLTQAEYDALKALAATKNLPGLMP